MIYVFHGENEVASRKAFRQALKPYEQNQVQLIRLDTKILQPTDLIQAAQSESLFNQDKVVVLERLFGLPRSPKKQALIAQLAALGNDESTVDLLLWESKKLTATQTKAIPSAKFQEFKISKKLFAFLKAIKPGNYTNVTGIFEQTLKDESEELILVMLVRQIRLLLILADGGNPKLPAWQLRQLQAQAGSFSTKQLLTIYHELLQIDKERKQGEARLPLAQRLDFMLTKI